MQKTSTLVSTSLQINKSKQCAEMPIENLEPSDFIIHNILNFSKSLTVKKSNTVGFIEMIAS